MSTKNIITPSFTAFCIEMQELFEQGYRLDVDNYPTQWGIAYEAHLVKDDHKEEFVAAFKEDVIVENNTPKRGRKAAV